MALVVLAYPQLEIVDYDWIQDYRKAHDVLHYGIVEPHFTIVFPVFNIHEELFVEEIRLKAKGRKAIPFEIKCATINKDAFNNYYHVFLVPDQGFGEIVRLHDILYSGVLNNNLRLDIDFIPHIGIGNSTDSIKVKAMVDHLNEKEFLIKGTITHLTIADFTNNVVTAIEEIILEK